MLSVTIKIFMREGVTGLYVYPNRNWIKSITRGMADRG